MCCTNKITPASSLASLRRLVKTRETFLNSNRRYPFIFMEMKKIIHGILPSYLSLILKVSETLLENVLVMHPHQKNMFKMNEEDKLGKIMSNSVQQG